MATKPVSQGSNLSGFCKKLEGNKNSAVLMFALVSKHNLVGQF